MFLFKIKYLHMFHSISFLLKIQFFSLENILGLFFTSWSCSKLLIDSLIDHSNWNIIVECLRNDFVSFTILGQIYEYVISIWECPAPIWNLVRKTKGPSLLKLLSLRYFLTPFDSITIMTKRTIRRNLIYLIYYYNDRDDKSIFINKNHIAKLQVIIKS